MPISEKEFVALKGKPARVGGVNPNSMAQRCLKALPEKGGMTAEELVSAVKTETDDEKKLVMALNALTYDKVKSKKSGERVTKAIKKHDNDGIAYYKKNPDF